MHIKYKYIKYTYLEYTYMKCTYTKLLHVGSSLSQRGTKTLRRKDIKGTTK